MIKSPKTMANLMPFITLDIVFSTFAQVTKFGFREHPDHTLSTVSVIDCRKGYKLACVKCMGVSGGFQYNSSRTFITASAPGLLTAKKS